MGLLLYQVFSRELTVQPVSCFSRPYIVKSPLLSCKPKSFAMLLHMAGSNINRCHCPTCELHYFVKPGTHHAIFVFCWTQRRRKDDCRMVCAHQRRSSSVDFTNATVVGPIRKTNRSNNCCMVCAGQRHLSHQPTGHRPITVKHFRDA